MNKPRRNFSLSQIALTLLKEASKEQQLSQSATLEALIRQHLSPKPLQGNKDWLTVLGRIDELETKEN